MQDKNGTNEYCAIIDPKPITFKVLGFGYLWRTDNRYYYDIEVNNKKEILSVGGAMHAIISSNLPDINTFALSKKDGLIPVPPAKIEEPKKSMTAKEFAEELARRAAVRYPYTGDAWKREAEILFEEVISNKDVL